MKNKKLKIAYMIMLSIIGTTFVAIVIYIRSEKIGETSPLLAGSFSYISFSLIALAYLIHRLVVHVDKLDEKVKELEEKLKGNLLKLGE